MCRHKFRMGSTTDNPHDAIPFMPAVRIRARVCYFAGKFQPGNVLRLARWRSISARSLQEVRAIERGTPNVNENFFRPGLWFRHIVDFQNLRATEMSNDNSFHSDVN